MYVSAEDSPIPNVILIDRSHSPVAKRQSEAATFFSTSVAGRKLESRVVMWGRTMSTILKGFSIDAKVLLPPKVEILTQK